MAPSATMRRSGLSAAAAAAVPRMSPLPTPSLTLSLLLLSLLLHPTTAILPTGSIDVTSPTTGEKFTLLTSQASYGSYPPMGPRANPLLELMLPPDDDELLCAESQGKANYTNPSSSSSSTSSSSSSSASASSASAGASSSSSNPKKIMLVPRGTCTFERKSLSAQRLGASAILIYGTLSSRYALNKTILGPNATDAEKKAAEERVYTLDDVLWPQDKYDYDCNYGRAEVPTSVLSFDPLPYDGRTTDPKLTGTAKDGNLCAINSSPLDKSKSSSFFKSSTKNFEQTCPSQRCLLTGKKSTSTTNGGTVMEGCCAWDLHVWLYADPSIPQSEEAVRIPAMYLTMEQGSRLLQLYNDAKSGTKADNENVNVGVTMYARWTPRYNPSAAIIWALGVGVAFIAAWMSASEYRNVRLDARKRMFEMAYGRTLEGSAAGGRGNAVGEGRDEEEASGFHAEDHVIEESAIPPPTDDGPSTAGRGRVRSRSRSRSPPSPKTAEDREPLTTTQHQRQQQQQQQQGAASPYQPPATLQTNNTNAPNGGNGSNVSNVTNEYRHLDSRHSSAGDESLELSASHALGFVVMASLSLTVLFVFKVYNVVKIMYAFGCSGAVTQVLFLPLYDRLGGMCRWSKNRHATAFYCGSEIGPVSYLDLIAAASGYGLGLAWLITAFVAIHPEEYTFFWITQDVMGACMCIMFLSVIKLNSIRVASILLIVAFLYDIFFVFVTPLLTKGGKSVMITVATSGGPPKADPSWCEKYPRDADCAGGDPLPMLLTVPRLFDYQGGSSLLGLGDIVLPGLLLSFAARFDEAKRLVGMLGGGGGGGGMMDNTVRFHGLPGSGWASSCCCRSLCNGGYLIPVTVAYAVGLLMANAAVYLMQMGQPALLYLVPCCLGTMVFLGWRRNELHDLWDGPRAVRAADALLYGEEGGGEGAAVPGGDFCDDDGNGNGNEEGGGASGGGEGFENQPTIVVGMGGGGDASRVGGGDGSSSGGVDETLDSDGGGSTNRGDVPLLSSRKKKKQQQQLGAVGGIMS